MTRLSRHGRLRAAVASAAAVLCCAAAAPHATAAVQPARGLPAAAAATLTASSAPARLGSGPWDIWEQFGPFAVGAPTLLAGEQVREVGHPGRSILFTAITTYNGHGAGWLSFNGGLVAASNSGCTGVTLKADPQADGTIWEPVGNLIINRRCDQDDADGSNVVALAGRNQNGSQFIVCGGALTCPSGALRAVTYHTP
jgi:hypothetical protein